jgi:hydroxysqualene synthase
VVTEAAYARCLDIAQRHYENFPVASRLLPRRARPHIAAIYAFARIADDFADEGTRSPAARLALLDDWQDRLHRAVATPRSEDDSDAAAIFHALGDSIRQCNLDVQLFDDLLSAFRQDVTVRRYETWDELLDYCRRSANPVGRLVLRVNGYRDHHLDACSDAVCTALQLTNFWQDLELDLKKDRLYVPVAEMRAAGANIEDLRRFRLTPEWRRAMEAAGARTRALFEAGRPVADGVRGRLRWELRATWLGGMRILDQLAAAGYDVFTVRPTLGAFDAVVIAGRALTWRPRATTSSSGPTAAETL